MESQIKDSSFLAGLPREVNRFKPNSILSRMHPSQRLTFPTDFIQMGNIELERNRPSPAFAQHRFNLNAHSLPQTHDTLRHQYPKSPLTDNIDTRRSRSPRILAQPKKATQGRVGDFNDFLTEIKRHMATPETQLSASQREQGCVERERVAEEESSNELVLKFRLENQKLQLEKYRRLVERELSKNHSVQKITIEGNNNQKTLTIQYENLPPKQGFIVRKTPNKAKPDATTQQICSSQTTCKGLLSQARRTYQQLRARVEVLQHIIALYDQSTAPSVKQPRLAAQGRSNAQNLEKETDQAQKTAKLIARSHKKDSSGEVVVQRVNRISNLFHDLHRIQDRQIDLEEEIKAALQLKRFDSESSGVVELGGEVAVSDVE